MLAVLLLQKAGGVPAVAQQVPGAALEALIRTAQGVKQAPLSVAKRQGLAESSDAGIKQCSGICC
jgi:hypothetical protein